MPKLLLLISILFFVSCSNMLGDFHGPQFSGDWVIEFDDFNSSDYSADTVTLDWPTASDESHSSSKITYKVYVTSDDPNGSSSYLNSSNLVGTVKGDTTLTLPKTEDGMVGYVTIVAIDPKGNKTIFKSSPISLNLELLNEFDEDNKFLPRPDTLSPTPGAGSGEETSTEIIATTNSPTSVGLKWLEASDNKSGETDLEYKVVISKSENIDTVDNAEKNGTAKLDWTKDVDSVDLTDLEPNTTYWYNVIVKDSSNNKAVYKYGKITTDKTGDTTSPIPGNGSDGGSSTIKHTVTSPTKAELEWDKAKDPNDETAKDKLKYKVVISTKDNIQNLIDADINEDTDIKEIIQDWGSYSTPLKLSGLTPETDYWYNVIVKDESGNKAVYKSGSFTTPKSDDSTEPTPGGTGGGSEDKDIIITPTPGDNTEAKLTWKKAGDNKTDDNDLEYKVVISEEENIDSVENAITNGIEKMSWTQNIDSFTLTGLDPKKDYWYNVIVKDSSENMAVYQYGKIEGDRTLPTPGGSDGSSEDNEITGIPKAGSNTEAILSWKKAGDDKTGDSDLEYKVVISEEENIDSVNNALNNGTEKMPWTKDVDGFDLTGLNPGTTYWFNVIVRDSANNMAVYKYGKVTTTIYQGITVNITIEELKQPEIVSNKLVSGSKLVLSLEKAYDKIEYKLNDESWNITSGDSITIENLDVRVHTLTLFIYEDDKPFSQTIRFNVTQ